MSQSDIFLANTHLDYSSCKHNGGPHGSITVLYLYLVVVQVLL
jgi:hypothetical protein